MLGERDASGVLAAASKSQLLAISHNISEVQVVPFIEFKIIPFSNEWFYCN